MKIFVEWFISTVIALLIVVPTILIVKPGAIAAGILGLFMGLSVAIGFLL